LGQGSNQRPKSGNAFYRAGEEARKSKKWRKAVEKDGPPLAASTNY